MPKKLDWKSGRKNADRNCSRNKVYELVEELAKYLPERTKQYFLDR